MFKKKKNKPQNNKNLLSPVTFWNDLKRNKIMWLMVLPAIVYTIIFSYIPMVGAVIAFQDYKINLGIFGSPWVGLKNFSYFIKSGKMWSLTVNTISYNVAFILIGTICKIFMAILIHEMCTRRYKRFLQSAMMLPHFLSWVIIGGLAYNLLNYEFGSINNLLVNLGFERINVYDNPRAWRYIFVIANVWHGLGYGMIFYLAALTGINPELYEAAYLDGAGLIKRIRYITIPLLIPTTVILLLLSIGGILSGNMDMFYQLVGNNPNLYAATDVIDTYVFRTLTQLKDFTITSAAGLYQQVVGLVLVLVSNAVVKKIDPDSAIF